MSVKKTIRIPEDIDAFIQNLEKRYGKDYTARLIQLLYVGKDRIELEKSLTHEHDQYRERKKTAE
jgi:hypothetical protein